VYDRLECCERNRNVERTHPQPPDPQSETGTLATNSGKRHGMEERQSFEKARNIEASILKKIKIRSSTESSVRWGSEQDSLQNKKDSG